MLKDGMYVWLRFGSSIHMGTISERVAESGRTRFLFEGDPRFLGHIPRAYCYDTDLAEGERLSDEHVSRLNASFQRSWSELASTQTTLEDRRSAAR